MRKRAQFKMETTTSSSPSSESTTKEVKPERHFIKLKKNSWTTVTLIGIFCLVLLMNTYFNFISDVNLNPEGTTLDEKFYLSGPDPYYNMRLVEETVQTGRYPYYSENDPLLNYPIGRSGGRAPLLNMLAIGFSNLLTPFMSQSDALGYSMQFVPALFGALLIIPIYYIGKTLFGRKEGIIAALLIAIIPIHIASGHGSAYGLFDHDSLNLLLFFLTFMFLVKSITEKDRINSMVYAFLAGLCVAGLSLVWVEAQFLFVIIGIYVIAQILIDIFTKKINQGFAQNMAIILFVGYFISLPVRITRMEQFYFENQLMICILIAALGVFCYIIDKKKIPWVLSFSLLAITAAAFAIFLFFVPDLTETYPFLKPLGRISGILYGTAGIYGSKVDLTIAEAGTYNISRSWMSYGPALLALAWIGFILVLIRFYRQKKREHLFIIMLFLINIWLAGTAGRFLNDVVPVVALLAGFVIWYLIEKVNYSSMIKNIRHAGGGLRSLRKGIKMYQVLGVLFIFFLIMMPNVFLSLDAAVPYAASKNKTSNFKIDYFGKNFSGAFGSSSYKEQYWVDAFSWLKQQDTHIENPVDRPAFISWWDYGFYEVAVGDHPTVADNFQDGIPPAANLHTATSEKEAVIVFIIRLLEGDFQQHEKSFSPTTVAVLQKHLSNITHDPFTVKNVTYVNITYSDLLSWIEKPQKAPSYLKPIGSEYDKELSKDLVVGEQFIENVYYHDITAVLNHTLTEEQVTWLYHDLQEATGRSIRYYGAEGYDRDIFNIFGFLGDKSLVLHALRTASSERFHNAEDDFIQVRYKGYKVNPQTGQQIGSEQTWTAAQLNAMSASERRSISITDTAVVSKPAYNNTMFYRTYLGESTVLETVKNQLLQVPCWGLKHFTADYVSTLPYPGTQGFVSVVIAKYYEGAKINGTITYKGEPLDVQVVVRKNISLYGTSLGIDHDTTKAANGMFQVIAPAGNITLELRRNPELGMNAFPIKAVHFNSETDPEQAPITDDEAMRKQGTNYERTLNIEVIPGVIQGYVYANNDYDESYNTSIDTPLHNASITLIEIKEFYPLNDPTRPGQPKEYGYENLRQLTTDEHGYYQASDLMPGIYLIQAVYDDFRIHENYVFIYPGNNTYNMSKPQPAAVNGIVYFDANKNNKVDHGEEMPDVTVELIYTETDRKVVNTMITGADGSYSFSSIIPGNYVLNVTKRNSTTKYLDYAKEQTINLEANKTKVQNISITYAPITVTGSTQHRTTPLGNIPIQFTANRSVKNNTAQSTSATTDETGMYSVQLQPGSYNVTVNYDGEQGFYSFTGALDIPIGQGVATYNIALLKKSVTIQGKTLYNGLPTANISIDFIPDYSDENNTAQYASKRSDEHGRYTVELKPGRYNVTVEETRQELGQNVTYRFAGYLDLREDEVDIARTYDIILLREIEG
ncbi:MAG: STT3 domain-containing protein [Candidatus Thermoplasmatota archaeon]